MASATWVHATTSTTGHPQNGREAICCYLLAERRELQCMISLGHPYEQSPFGHEQLTRGFQLQVGAWCPGIWQTTPARRTNFDEHVALIRSQGCGELSDALDRNWLVHLMCMVSYADSLLRGRPRIT